MNSIDMLDGRVRTTESHQYDLYLDIATSEINPLEEIIGGMSQAARSLPSKLFYDKIGSSLFDEITTLPEYYLSRTEHSILENNLPEIISMLPSNPVLIEYGSGSSINGKGRRARVEEVSM